MIQYFTVMMKSEKGTNNIKAIVSTLLAFLMLSSVSVLAKLEMQAGASLEWVVFMQFTVSLILVVAIASRRGFGTLRAKNVKFQMVRGIAGTAAFTCYAISFSKIPLVNASLLNNTAPIFIPIVTYLWLRVPIDKNIWWGIIVGFAGILLILDPSAESFLKVGDLYGLASGISLAIAYTALGRLTKSETFVSIIFYYTSICVIALLPFAIINWTFPDPYVYVLAAASGVLYIAYLFTLQYAYKYMPAVKLSPLIFSAVVFTGLLDWIVFGNVPGWTTVSGIVLVIAGGLLAIMIHEKDNEELRHHWQ